MPESLYAEPSSARGSMHPAAHIEAFFASIARRYDLANHLLSSGLDLFWRRRTANLVSQWKPGRVLDLATGSGDLALALQRACPDAEIVASDFCEPMLQRARAKGVRHVVQADALNLPFETGSFDAVTCAFGLRNMESWPKALAECARVLRSNGHLAVLDFSTPSGWLGRLYRPYLHYVLPRVAGWLTGQPDAYRYLAESIDRFPQGDAMLAFFVQAGFSATRAEPLSGGIVTLYCGKVDLPATPH